MPILSEPADELAAILSAAWDLLRAGAADADDDAHWPVLATGGSAGPDARTVVLRAAHPADRQLLLHSDRRAGKLAALATDPRACLVVHHGRRRIQVRAWGEVAVATDGDAVDAAWARLSPASRAMYAQAIAPGTPVAAPEAASPIMGDGRDRFALLTLTVRALDWLALRAAPHRRARFDWSEPGAAPVARWLAP